MHDGAYMVDVQRITLNASCMTISDERTEQLDIFCGFTSDFLSFIDVEFIWFFHGALQLATASFLLQGHVSGTRFHLLSLTRLL